MEARREDSLIVWRITETSMEVMIFGWGLVAQMAKNLPAVRETRISSLGWESPLEKEMATHSSILAWRVPWTEEPGGLQSMGLDMAEQLTFTFTLNITILQMGK